MSSLRNVQTNFAAGEIDPLVSRRVDMAQYRNALKKARNVLIQPQGGMRVRPGTKFIYQIPSGANPDKGIRLISFEFTEDDSYMLLFTRQRMYIFKNQALVTNINGSGNDYLTTGIGFVRTIEMQWAQSFDTLLLFHPEIPTKRVTRGATDADWTISDVTWTNTPLYPFTVSKTQPSHRLYVENASGSTLLHAEGTRIGITDTVGIGAEAYAEVNASGVITGVTVTQTGKDYGTSVNTIAAIGPTGSGATFSATLAAGQITDISVTSGGTGYTQGPFDSNDVGQYITPNNGLGRARIVEVLSDTTVRVSMVQPFANTGYIESGEWTLEGGYEPVWSVARGYPRSGTFHKGRLYIGGSKSLPSHVWGSRISDLFDFDLGDALDDEATETTVDASDQQVITSIRSGTDLQVFTTGGEYYMPENDLEPIRPGNFRFKQASSRGAKPFTPIVKVGNASVFLQRQGKQLVEFYSSGENVRYADNDISIMSSHLLNNPQDLAYKRRTRSDEGDLLLVANDDGSLYVLSIVRNQEIVAAQHWTTQGDFATIGVDVDTIYAVVEREIDGSTVYFVEVFDDTATTDCAKQGGAASSATLSHLPNTDVQLVTDDYFQGEKTTNGSGVVAFDNDSDTYYEVGLDYTVDVETLPAHFINDTLMMAEKKRIVQVVAFVENTQTITVQGYRQELNHIGQFNEGGTEPFDGSIRVHALPGWSTDATIQIGRAEPLSMTILSLDARLQVGAL